MESDREEHVDCSPLGLTTREAGDAGRQAAGRRGAARLSSCCGSISGLKMVPGWW